MSKNTTDAIATPNFSLSTPNGAAPAPDFTDLDSFFNTVQPARESANIGGVMCYFEAPSPEDKDKLIAAHASDDGDGKTTVESKKWQTNVIAMTWVKSFGGARVLGQPADAERFYTRKGYANVEKQMYQVAARVAGLGDKDKETRRKNSDDTRTTSTSLASP